MSVINYLPAIVNKSFAVPDNGSLFKDQTKPYLVTRSHIITKSAGETMDLR